MAEGVKGRDIPEENGSRDSQLDDEEKETIGFLADLGFEYLTHDKFNLIVSRQPDVRSRQPSSSRRSFPRAYVPMLLHQLGVEVEDHPNVTGLVIPSRGYVELICSRLKSAMARRAFRLECGESACEHKDPAKAMPSFPYHWLDEEGGQSVKRIHLSGGQGEPCVELSNASPLALLLYGHLSESSRVRLAHPRFPFLATLKLAYDSAVDGDWLGRRSEETARSLIYELNVRNGVVLELDTPPVGPDVTVTRWVPEISNRIGYPRTRVEKEVAILFGFASQVVGDPPQAFLSYYQALESFIPSATRRSVIKEIRRELREPGFDDESDTSLLRIINAAEGTFRANEPHQLRTVIKEYVDPGRLREFFTGHDWRGYFARQGPISGVQYISLNADQSLSDQVAIRVYQIRNRIVHAKDDPRFPRVLLPWSSEANALTPDVLLVRLLATEAISVGSSTHDDLS